MAADLVPLDASAFMHLIGIVEMAVGVVILSGYTRVGGHVAAAWILGMALNLVATGWSFDMAVREVAIAMAAFALARLRKPAWASPRASLPAGRAS